VLSQAADAQSCASRAAEFEDIAQVASLEAGITTLGVIVPLLNRVCWQQ
jgi:hypothetical protein